MANRITKYLVQGVGQPLEQVDTNSAIDLGPTEVLVRIHAVAINPADIKTIDQGHRISSWPIVPGLDGAGIVHSAGSDVTAFQPGDEVLGMFQLGERTGSYQTLAVAQESMLAKKPRDLSFEDAASLPVSYFTAMMSLGIGLKTPLPFVEDGMTDGFKPASVLILGGSSALGAAAIQLLRLAVPDCTILTTSSPKHFSHLSSLGVNTPLDRSSTSLVSNAKAATPSGKGVEALLDLVGAGASQADIFDALDPDGPRKYAQVWTGEDEIPVPDGVESVLFRSRDWAQVQGGKHIMAALGNLLSDESYKLPLPVNAVGKGLEGLRKGLDLMRKGVSGEKLVVTISNDKQ